MRTYICNITLVILAFCLLSCRQEVCPEFFEGQAEGREALVHKSFVIGDEALTRATLDSEMRTRWELKDEFSVYDPIAKKGRKFTVTQVNGSSARIEGDISKGEFKLSIVFPYSGTSWNSDGTWNISVSKTQKPQNSRNVERNALVCGVRDADPSAIIHLEALTSLVKFNIDRGDISSVSLRLCSEKGGGFVYYTLAPYDSTAFRQKTYYLSVEKGEYQGGAKIVYKTSEGKTVGQSTGAALALENGRIAGMGKASNAKEVVPYSLEQTRTFTDINDYLEQISLTRKDLDDVQKYVDDVLDDLLTSEQKKVAVNSYIMEYESRGPDGSPVTLTARIYIPQPGLNGRKLMSAQIFNRSELGKNKDAPTNNYNAECVAAWFGDGSAIYIPDYYGMGCKSVVSQPQSFIDSPFTAEGVIDGLVAFLQVLNDFNVNYGGKIYNAGYGQGGAVAMANLRHVSLHPELGLHIDKTFAGGGFYNFRNNYDAVISYEMKKEKFFSKKTKSYAKYQDSLPYFIFGIANLNKCQGLGLNMANVLKPAMYSKLEDRVFKKKYSVKYVTNIGINKENRNLVTDHLSDGMMDQSSYEAKALLNAMDSYSLCTGWSIPVGSEIYLYHYENDSIFPYSNYEEMKAFLGNGRKVHYFSKDQLDQTKGYYNLASPFIKNHRTAAIPFCLWIYDSLF